jgi:hypothetical protein
MDTFFRKKARLNLAEPDVGASGVACGGDTNEPEASVRCDTSKPVSMTELSWTHP